MISSSLPPPPPLPLSKEALAQVRVHATQAGEAALWAAHTAHWLQFWGRGSQNRFLSILDMWLEALYFITQAMQARGRNVERHRTRRHLRSAS